MSAGFISYWTDKFFRPPYLRSKEISAGPKQMTLQILFGSFQMIVLGWFLSFLIFLAELVDDKVRNSKKIRKILTFRSRFNNIKNVLLLILISFTRKTREYLVDNF